MGQVLDQLKAHEISDALQAGEVSVSEVVEFSLERIEKIDAKIQSFVDLWPGPARLRAGELEEGRKSGEKSGPLFGIPVGLKDNLCTTTGKTTCCSRILQGFESPYNATVVERLEAAGAVIIGKMNMDEFAMGSSTENSSRQQTRNPWDLSRVPGGSSGGPAAAVAAGEIPIALGSDTGGSIRQPAAFCGCVAMKPTYGRVSRYGLVAYASSLDQIGAFSRDVEDLALVLGVISGHDPMDATSADIEVPDYTASLIDDVRGLRIGLPTEYFSDGVDAEVREKVEAAVRVLEEHGAKPVEVSLPHTRYAIATYYIVATAEASANLARFDGVRYGFRDPEARDIREMYLATKSNGFGKEVQRRIMLGTYALSSGYYDAYYLKAQKVRTLIRRDFDAAFKTCDLLVTPTAPTAAFKVGEKVDDPLQMYLADIFTISANLAGIPGLVVPCGLTGSKLPVGMQLLGKAFDEATLIRTAYTYEQNRGFDLGEPPLK